MPEGQKDGHGDLVAGDYISWFEGVFEAHSKRPVGRAKYLGYVEEEHRTYKGGRYIVWFSIRIDKASLLSGTGGESMRPVGKIVNVSQHSIYHPASGVYRKLWYIEEDRAHPLPIHKK